MRVYFDVDDRQAAAVVGLQAGASDVSFEPMAPEQTDPNTL